MKTDMISTGDTLDLAIENGLKEMNLTIDEIEYEVLEEGRSILNVVLKPYRVRLTKKEKDPIIKDEDAVSEPTDASVEIEVARDLMDVYVTLIPPNGGEMISLDQLYGKLEEKNITYGILHDNIRDIMDNLKFNTKTLVAKGKPKKDGIDGKIKILFETSQKITPKVLENGKVDFKELNMIKNVKKGDILAEKILPVEGTDGVNVMGRTLKAKPGKLANFKYGKNVVESEDGSLLMAAEDGCPKLMDDKVTVLQIYEVHGNVDNSIGNVYFNGKIIVKGNVCTGFKIQCEGDVEVFGVVEGAEIIAEGDIILHKGIQGNNAGKLFSKGNITANYIENAYINAHGYIQADVVLHSILESKDLIQVTGKKGILVGGEIRANKEISAESIGSPMATSTKLEVGVDPELKQKFESIKQELDTLYKNRENVMKAIELLNKLAKKNALSKEKEEVLQKSIKTRAYLEDKIKNCNSSLIKLQEVLQSLSEGKVNARKVIYPGVKISIGNSSIYIRDNIQNVTVYREDSEIKKAVYMKKSGA